MPRAALISPASPHERACRFFYGMLLLLISRRHRFAPHGVTLRVHADFTDADI